MSFSDTNLVVLSVTSRSITTASFISGIGAPVELMTLLITLFFTLSNRFVKLFLSKFKSKNSKKKKNWNDS